MKHIFNHDLFSICRKIQLENKSQGDWAMIESGDMFQEGRYVGGFDATEMEFTFSVYENEKEYWFQLSLNEISEILEGRKKEIDIVEADY